MTIIGSMDTKMQKNNRSLLFICPYPRESAPSQRFRFEQYYATLIHCGFHLEIRPFLSLSGWSVLYLKGHFLQKIASISRGYLGRLGLFFYSIPRADIIFIHREASPLGPPIFEFLITKIFKKKTVYDFDDAIWIPNTSDQNNLVANLKWPSKTQSICTWGHKVSCGNEYLAAFAQQFNKSVVVNPTTIDTISLHNPDLHQGKSNDEVIDSDESISNE